jgi:hypothetical protein
MNVTDVKCKLCVWKGKVNTSNENGQSETFRSNNKGQKGHDTIIGWRTDAE